VLLPASRGAAESGNGVVRDGTLGVVPNEQATSVLLAAIRKVHAGEAWIGRKVVTSLLQDTRRARRSDHRARSLRRGLQARPARVVAPSAATASHHAARDGAGSVKASHVTPASSQARRVQPLERPLRLETCGTRSASQILISDWYGTSRRLASMRSASSRLTGNRSEIDVEDGFSLGSRTRCARDQSITPLESCDSQ
jgi:hypothetical protein